MKRIFVFEWKRMIRSKTLLFSAVAAALIVIADVFAWFRLYQQDVDVYTSVFNKWLGTQPAIGAGSYLHIVLPLLTAFAYSWSVSYDRSSGYIAQTVTRIGRRRYFTAKYLVSFISGGMIFVGALVLDFMLLGTFSPAFWPSPDDLASPASPFTFGSVAFYQSPYLFVLMWCGVAFLWGGAMASMGTAAGMLIKNHIVSSVVPFLVFTAQQLLAVFAMQKYRIAINGKSIALVWTEQLCAAPLAANLPVTVFSSIGFIVVVSTLIYVLRGRKYECL